MFIACSIGAFGHALARVAVADFSSSVKDLFIHSSRVSITLPRQRSTLSNMHVSIQQIRDLISRAILSGLEMVSDVCFTALNYLYGRQILGMLSFDHPYKKRASDLACVPVRARACPCVPVRARACVRVGSLYGVHIQYVRCFSHVRVRSLNY